MTTYFKPFKACWTGKASEQIELVRDWLDTSPKNQYLFKRLSKTHYQLRTFWHETHQFLQGKRKIEFPSEKTKEILPLEIPCIRCSSRLLNSFCSNKIHSSRTVPEKRSSTWAQMKSGSPKATLIFDNGKKDSIKCWWYLRNKIKKTPSWRWWKHRIKIRA